MRVIVELTDSEIRNAVCNYLIAQGFEANPNDIKFQIDDFQVDDVNKIPNCITSSVAATPANQVNNLQSDYWNNR